MTTLTSKRLAEILTGKKPEISYELAFKLAEIIGECATQPATLTDSVKAARLLLQTINMPEQEIQDLINLGIKNVSFAFEWLSDESDAGVFFGIVFNNFSETNSSEISVLVVSSNPQTIWGVICACPSDIWINLMSTPNQ